MEEKQLIQEVSNPLYLSKGWMKFVGVMLVIQGIATALTIFGIIICWIPIWMGVLLFQSANQIELANSSGSEVNLTNSLAKIKTYFTISGILYLIALIGVLIAIIITGGAFFSFLNLLS